MDYVKISLAEYDKLKESYNAFRKKKVLKIRVTGFFTFDEYSESYYTESEVIESLTEKIKSLEIAIDKVKERENLLKEEIASKKMSFLDWIRKIVNK
jgi:glutamate synthase domain-containing protein 2